MTFFEKGGVKLMAKKRKSAAKTTVTMSSGKNACMMCGAGGGSCHCGSWVIVWGLILLLLGILLWLNRLTLNSTVAIVLVLMGLKKFFMGVWMCKQ